MAFFRCGSNSARRMSLFHKTHVVPLILRLQFVYFLSTLGAKPTLNSQEIW